MADKDEFNEEYQFADLDEMTPDTGDEGVVTGADVDEIAATEPNRTLPQSDNNVKRNAVIAIFGFIVLMFLYEVVGYIFSGPKNKTTSMIPVQKAAAPPVIQAPQPIAPIVEQQPKSTIDSELSQKLSTLDGVQNSMRSDLDSVNNQLNGMNQNLNSVIAKMAELNTLITNLSQKVDQQSRELEQMAIRREHAKRISHVSKKTAHATLKYYIQAVIPGRAWLIGTNGTTLTVSEGTLIHGYGMVKLIDPNQGRVLTSSGQVIRFSQQDS